ncbi:Dihydrofolate reductase [Aquimixticola soesokkakensis]|uniref:Dihydrofolate reductase n=1 Tax=Aquimixticola soesokkakensis TaxID=1519096 RepID=A0A1Y5SWE3_9RHOB|nr:dihydrofolate reductase [Aquimixticola soesokkakensis]SLN50028.1 Dihydrofolate reductase [Aquimixticola soesokkakensis]
MISLIVARARGGAIGRGGDIPWDIPEDLKAFWRETMGGAVIMGRRTWESLPVKPLKSRFNIVVSRSEVVGAGASCTSLEAALCVARDAGYHRIYGMGGQAIYAALLPQADRLLVSEVDLEVPDADTFFPDFDAEAWREVGRQVLRAGGAQDAGPPCVMRELLRA